MTLSTYITNDEIAVLVVYLVSLTGGLLWALYRIYVLEKREKLWRELVDTWPAYYDARTCLLDMMDKDKTDLEKIAYEKKATDFFYDKALKLKQQLGYDN